MPTGLKNINLISASPPTAVFAAPHPPCDVWTAAWQVARAAATGGLRSRFYDDVRAYGSDVDAPRFVAAAYVSLGACFSLLLGLIAIIVLTPDLILAHIAQMAAAWLCFSAFAMMTLRRDPRPFVNAAACVFLLGIAVAAYNHAGILPPVVWTAPAVAAIVGTFVRGRSGLITAGLGVAVAAFVFLTSSSIIGRPSPYSQETRSFLAFLDLVIAVVGLACLAWLSEIARDFVIDQLRAANNAVMENSSRSRIALEAAKVGLWDVPNAELRRFDVTESFHSITGYTAEEFNRCFDALEDFVHPDDILDVREAFAVGRARLSRLRIDFRLMTRNRGYRWFSARAKYLKNPDGTIRISGSLQDINFIKAAEEALRAGRDQARQADRAKSDFIAVMSHEVRTPLNAILGSVQVLKRQRHDEASAELLDLIGDAGHGLLNIVNDMLDVSRIEAGKIAVMPGAVDLCELVTRTAEIWRAEAEGRGLTLDVDLGASTCTPVMADADRLRQIIGNLLSNAIKFTDQGGITVGLRMQDDPCGRMQVEIRVSDSGRGVPPSQAAAIFEPFEQGASDDRRGGAGLGLYISRRLARMMGGDLTLDAGTARGSIFRLNLVADRAGAIEIQASAPAPHADWSGRTVLCVDDNAANRRIAALLLEQLGFAVTTRTSGAEALAACASAQYDLLMLDIVMPGMDGMEVLRRIRADTSSPNQKTPAIALTARIAASDLEAYRAAGFESVASKPINVAELAQAMALLVEPAPETQARRA